MRNRLICLIAICLGVLGALPLQAERVAVIPLHGEVSEAQFLFLRRALKEAGRDRVDAVVIDLNTPGGSYNVTEKMQKALDKVSVPTITYVNPKATSAGALIAVSTKKIYMSPVSSIGAAAPVQAGGQDLPETLQSKAVADSSAFFRSAAERNGHNPEIVEAFINKDKEVKIGERVIHAKGAPLSLSAGQATEVIDGKPVLAAGIAESLNDLLKQAGYAKAEVVTIEPKGTEALAFWITTLAPILLLGGMAGAWIELKTPGFGIPGIASIICFGFFFFGHYIAGLAGWELPVIFAIGLVLVLLEFLVFPGLVVPGLIGALMMAGAIFWAMVDRFPGGSWLPETESLYRPIINIGIASLMMVALAMLLARFLPKTKLYRRFVLADQIASGPALPREQATIGGLQPGTPGVAVSDLRPSGTAEFGGERIDVVSLSGFVDVGTEIEVVSVEAFHVAVKAKGA